MHWKTIILHICHRAARLFPLAKCTNFLGRLFASFPFGWCSLRSTKEIQYNFPWTKVKRPKFAISIYDWKLIFSVLINRLLRPIQIQKINQSFNQFSKVSTDCGLLWVKIFMVKSILQSWRAFHFSLYRFWTYWILCWIGMIQFGFSVEGKNIIPIS